MSNPKLLQLVGKLTLTTLLALCSSLTFGQASSPFGASDSAIGNSQPLRKFSKEKLYPGSTVEIQLNLAEATYYRRGKMFVTEYLPVGFMVDVTDSGGAEIIIEDDRLIFKFKKFRGRREKFTVSYTLFIPGDALGEYFIQGTVGKGDTQIMIGIGAMAVIPRSPAMGADFYNLPKTKFTVKQGIRLRPRNGGLNE